MKSQTLLLRVAGLTAVLALGAEMQTYPVQAQAPSAAVAPAAKAPGILNREQAGAILPASVFFRGQSASIQARNSAGVRLQDGKLLLATIVDTSGYSSGVAEKYQAYLIAEFPVSLEGKTLAPGAYGFGFIAGDQMVVMDIGGTELFRVPTSHNAALARPTPLQILQEGGQYRLYLGRNYVSFSAASGSSR